MFETRLQGFPEGVGSFGVRTCHLGPSRLAHGQNMPSRPVCQNVTKVQNPFCNANLHLWHRCLLSIYFYFLICVFSLIPPKEVREVDPLKVPPPHMPSWLRDWPIWLPQAILTPRNWPKTRTCHLNPNSANFPWRGDYDRGSTSSVGQEGGGGGGDPQWPDLGGTRRSETALHTSPFEEEAAPHSVAPKHNLPWLCVWVEISRISGGLYIFLGF